MNFKTYEKCRTIEAIDRVLDFLGTDEFQKVRKTAETGVVMCTSVRRRLMI